MRIHSILLGASVLLATMQAGFAQPAAQDGIIKKITLEVMEDILRKADYTVEIRQDGDTKYIRTTMLDYYVNINLRDCDKGGCGALGLSTGFDKSPKYTLEFANKWNFENNYAHANIDPSDGSFYLDYDFLVTGVKRDFIKESLSVYEERLQDFQKETQ